VAVQGPNLEANRAHAAKVRAALEKIPSLRDLQMAQPVDYPTVEVRVDRDRAGQFGLTTASVARSLVAATSSSRFIEPNYWRDPVSGNAFQIQVEIPPHRMASLEDVRNLPVMNADADGSRPLLSDVAELRLGTAMGLIERYNMQRVVSFTANIHGRTLGEVVRELRAAIRGAGDPPRGVTVAVRGQIPPLEETLSGLRAGLLLSIGVIFLLLAASFQSVRLALSVVATVPAAIAGALVLLWLSGTTMNVQSFMGSIMAIGISVANAILLVTFAEMSRRDGASLIEAAREGAQGRLRAILMTAAAMIAGMIPIALGFGEGSEQTAPLGRAVIGGLLAATFATLTVLPSVYAILQRKGELVSPSLDPSDPSSRYYDAA
jgi:multidrug efflux pump subunit AcrB